MRSKAELLEKAAKLMELAKRGATPGEVQAATIQLQRLMDTYNLSLNEIELAQEVSDIKREVYRTTYKVTPTWLVHLARDVADGIGVKAVFGYSGQIHYIGTDVDVTVATYFLHMLYYKLWEMANIEAARGGTNGAKLTQYRASFIIAASRVIRQRLEDERRVTATPTSTAIIVTKNEAIKQWINENMKVSRRTTQATYSGSGTADGTKAGQSIGLHRGVGTSNNAKLIG